MAIDIAVHPRFLYAGIIDSDGIKQMFVYRSPVVESYDAWMNPVYDFLATRCFEEVATITEEDDRMMSGEAVHTVYLVFDKCPGGTHNCRIDRIEE